MFINRLNFRAKILIIGGGTAGVTIGSKLSRKYKKQELIMMEPSDIHYYQPGFTLIGGGLKTMDDCRRPMKDIIPKGVTWIQDAITHIYPEKNEAKIANGSIIKYQLLIIAVGIVPNYDRVYSFSIML